MIVKFLNYIRFKRWYYLGKYQIKNKKLKFSEYIELRNKPANIKRKDLALFDNEFTYKHCNVYQYSLKNVNIAFEGIVFKGLRFFNPSIQPISKSFFFKFKFLIKKYLGHRINTNKNEKYLLLHDDWSQGYFHWFCDVLPKFIAYKDMFQNVTLILPDYTKNDFYKETIQTFNIKKIQYISKKSFLSVSNLIFIENIALSGNYNSNLMIAIRKHFFKYYEINTNSKFDFERIYLSREKANVRHIINEKQVVSVLKKYDFINLCFEDFSIKEKIFIMRNCKIIVGMHGANLTNMLFMPPQGAILELRKKDDNQNNAYFSLSSALEIKYYYQCCEYKTEGYTRPNCFDLNVDLHEIEENIKLMIANTI